MSKEDLEVAINELCYATKRAMDQGEYTYAISLLKVVVYLDGKND